MHFVKIWWDTFSPFHTWMNIYKRAVLLRAIFCWVSWRWALPEFLKKHVLLKICVLNFLSILSDFLLLAILTYVKSLEVLLNLNSWMFELTKTPILPNYQMPNVFRFYQFFNISHFFLCLFLLQEKICEN